MEDGHEVWLAENHQFDLIVLDIMLPERDGISILRHLGGVEKQCRSCSSLPAVKYKIDPLVWMAGADDYLVKPF